ncbi:MAG: hypothetical protein VB016_03650 [Methanomassiliicoccaceae archaeon]|nr:hypothetical protein [Methanomassiliicoccaceae archaeon]
MQPIAAPATGKKNVLIVTNDSQVFLSKRLEAAGDIFGGRVTEVRDFFKRLDAEFGKEGNGKCNVSFGIISTLFGFVPSTYAISSYTYAMCNKEQYEAAQVRKDYAGVLEYVSRGYDMVIVCVPKEMFRILIDNNALHDGKVVAVTSKEFEPLCKERNWTFLERKGARIGNENAEKIREKVSELTV